MKFDDAEVVTSDAAHETRDWVHGTATVRTNSTESN